MSNFSFFIFKNRILSFLNGGCKTWKYLVNYRALKKITGIKTWLMLLSADPLMVWFTWESCPNWTWTKRGKWYLQGPADMQVWASEYKIMDMEHRCKLFDFTTLRRPTNEKKIRNTHSRISSCIFFHQELGTQRQSTPCKRMLWQFH